MKLFIVLLAILFIATPLYAADDVFLGPATIQKGFLNGEDFLKLSESDKVYYSMGIIDGYLAATQFGANNKYLEWVSKCIEGKTNTQISAIFVKHLQDRPERWDKPAQVLMFEALRKGCK